MNYRGRKVAILGFGAEGKSALRYFRAQEADLTICDQDSTLKIPQGIKAQLGADYAAKLDQFDLIVRSPGISLSQIKVSKPITSVTKEFMAKCPAPIIGVTGTKGKGTTTTLIQRFLEASGHRAFLGGNIGVPPLDFLNELKPEDWVVLELSSYQLDDVKISPHIAVCLMISSDHLSYHGNQASYVEAKANLFRYQHRSDIAVYHQLNPDSARIATLSLGQKRPYFDGQWAHIREGYIWAGEREICRVKEVGLLGPHNLENIAAAINAVSGIVDDVDILARVIREFKGLEHRLEPVATIAGIQFINDSFATVPEATIAALQSFVQPKILILGGFDKGVDYTATIQEIIHLNTRAVLLMGQTTPKITKLLEAASYRNMQSGFKTMEGVVKSATEQAQNGDVILLSPGASSFDMFKDYQDRGQQFKASVRALARLNLAKEK